MILRSTQLKEMVKKCHLDSWINELGIMVNHSQVSPAPQIGWVKNSPFQFSSPLFNIKFREYLSIFTSIRVVLEEDKE
jgi:hypothetical protein